jgi:hypothetical protein
MTEQEHAIMRFESKWWRLAGSKESAIRDEFGFSPTRYYQLLHGLLSRQDVEAAYPVLVHRLRRQAARATRTRTLTNRLD